MTTGFNAKTQDSFMLAHSLCCALIYASGIIFISVIHAEYRLCLFLQMHLKGVCAALEVHQVRDVVISQFSSRVKMMYTGGI